MILLSKNQRWDLAADPKDLIGLIHEMERLLTDSASSIEGLGLKDYFVSSGVGESHGQVSADDLLDVVASLSKPLQSITSNYTNFKRGDDFYKFEIQLVRVSSDSRPVSVKVSCYGPSINDADRLFKQIFQQFARDIGRRNRLRGAAPTELSRPSPPTSQPTQIDRTHDEPTFWKVLTTNPFVIAVIGGLVVAGTVFLIGLYIQKDKTNDRPTAPPTTVTQTITTQIPAPSGLPSPQLPGGTTTANAPH